jgi:hypothetical protein
MYGCSALPCLKGRKSVMMAASEAFFVRGRDYARGAMAAK